MLNLHLFYVFVGFHCFPFGDRSKTCHRTTSDEMLKKSNDNEEVLLMFLSKTNES